MYFTLAPEVYTMRCTAVREFWKPNYILIGKLLRYERGLGLTN